MFYFVGPSRQSGSASASHPAGSGQPQGSHGSTVEGRGVASAGNGEDSRGKFVCKGKIGLCGLLFVFIAPSRQSGPASRNSSWGPAHSQVSRGRSVEDVGIGGRVQGQEELEDDGDSRGKVKF